MKTTEAILSRRAVKHYDPNYKLTDGEIRELIELARNAPTSFNIQNRRFLVVQDMEVRRELRAAAWDQAQVTDASLVVLLCGDLKAHLREPERYWRHAPDNVREMMVPALKQFYEGREWLQRDEVMRSCGMAAQTLMLAAQEKGLESCPMIGFNQEEVARIVNLPEDYVIGMMVVVGKGTKPAWPKGGQIPYEEVVTFDKWS